MTKLEQWRQRQIELNRRCTYRWQAPEVEPMTHPSISSIREWPIHVCRVRGPHVIHRCGVETCPAWSVIGSLATTLRGVPSHG